MGAWGTGEWGTGTWGGVTATPPTLGAVEDKLCDPKGGTVLRLFGSNFVHPVVVEVIDMVGLDVLGTAYYFDEKLDLRPTKLVIGMPALPEGTYGLKLTTPGGVTAVVPNAVTYVTHADEGKAQRVRRNFAEAWYAGRRVLR